MSAFLRLAVKDLKHIQTSEKETTQKHDSLLAMRNQSTHNEHNMGVSYEIQYYIISVGALTWNQKQKDIERSTLITKYSCKHTKQITGHNYLIM